MTARPLVLHLHIDPDDQPPGAVAASAVIVLWSALAFAAANFEQFRAGMCDTAAAAEPGPARNDLIRWASAVTPAALAELQARLTSGEPLPPWDEAVPP